MTAVMGVEGQANHGVGKVTGKKDLQVQIVLESCHISDNTGPDYEETWFASLR